MWREYDKMVVRMEGRRSICINRRRSLAVGGTSWGGGGQEGKVIVNWKLGHPNVVYISKRLATATAHRGRMETSGVLVRHKYIPGTRRPRSPSRYVIIWTSVCCQFARVGPKLTR